MRREAELGWGACKDGNDLHWGHFKINWDVAIDIQSNCMGFGVIIRDHNSVVCAAKSVKIYRAFEPVIGEAMAAMVEVKFSKEREIQDVILEGDSMQVVQALQDRNPSWRTYGHIIDDTRVFLGTCRSWTVHHVKRDANRAAHGLAKGGLGLATEHQWIDELPECISAIVYSELNAPLV